MKQVFTIDESVSTKNGFLLVLPKDRDSERVMERINAGRSTGRPVKSSLVVEYDTDADVKQAEIARQKAIERSHPCYGCICFDNKDKTCDNYFGKTHVTERCDQYDDEDK